MEFKRINKNSKIRFYGMQEFLNDESTLYSIEDKNLILQMITHEETDTIIVEYVSKLEEEMLDEPKSRADIDFENYLDTTLNKDPFGGKYSGMKLRTIFEEGDKQWLSTALKELKNEFIKDRLKYIVDRGGYGKIVY